jgi:DNA-binding MarR family transcriptional regulator
VGRHQRNPDYRLLLEFRTGLRRFLRWSEQGAVAAGLTPSQHQLLLAVRGHPDARGPTVGEVAEYLFLRHHSTVELVDRAEAANLVRRSRDPDDHRVVRLRLTPLGARRLKQLTEAHVDELARFVPQLRSLWEGLDGQTRQPPGPDEQR